MVRKIKVKSIMLPTDNAFYVEYKPVRVALKVLYETASDYSVSVMIQNQHDKNATIYMQGEPENINKYMLWLSSGEFAKYFTWKYQFTFKKKL